MYLLYNLNRIFYMTVQDEIKAYISGLPESKQADMQLLHSSILKIKPSCKLWFLDGKDEKGKIVSNPNIGYGMINMKYTDGTNRDFYQVGLSANSTGISVYIMGIKDKKYLSQTFAEKIGKASVTGYCIKFKSLKDINLKTLQDVVRFGFKNK